MKFLRDMIM